MTRITPHRLACRVPGRMDQPGPAVLQLGIRAPGAPDRRSGRAVMPQRIANGGRKPGRATPTEASFLRRRQGWGRLTSRSRRRTFSSPSTLSGVTLSPHLISRSSWLAGLLVLLLLGCGGHAVVTGTNPSSPSVGFTATPPLEGTGPASTSPGGGGGGGGLRYTSRDCRSATTTHLRKILITASALPFSGLEPQSHRGLQ